MKQGVGIIGGPQRIFVDPPWVAEGHLSWNESEFSSRAHQATLELLAGTDMLTLARQMDSSLMMLLQQYSTLTATLTAGNLAGLTTKHNQN
jgi:hypothetical protein